MKVDTIKQNKKIIIITILIIFTLIVIFSGVTYAFFTTNDNVGSTALITNTSGKMTITYADGGSNLLISSDINPNDSIIADKTFTLTGLNTTTVGETLNMPYQVGLKYTSTFSDGQIHYYIKKVSTTNDNIIVNYTGTNNSIIQGHDNETGYSHGTLKNGARYTEMVTGEFPANEDEQTITFNLKLQFPDNGENQDAEKGKTLNAEIIINHEASMIDSLLSLYDQEIKTNNIS